MSRRCVPRDPRSPARRPRRRRPARGRPGRRRPAQPVRADPLGLQRTCDEQHEHRGDRAVLHVHGCGRRRHRERAVRLPPDRGLGVEDRDRLVGSRLQRHLPGHHDRDHAESERLPT
ncbi:hypothetical protein CURTO8I2_70336 [Curtobacterium sp. 8I-2]|nr:hypothetical protein CURTO8I2_70336 [Curtobacterium sp. 8I-2]